MGKFTMHIFSLATVLSMAFSVNTVLGQVVGDYRTQTGSDGNWSTPANWQVWNGTTWGPATDYPRSTDGVITISKAIIVDIDVTVDQVVCTSGTALTVNNGFTLTIANGTTKPDFTEANTDVMVNGTLIINSGAVAKGGGADDANKGSIAVNSGGNLYLNGTITGPVAGDNWTTTVNAGGIMTISTTGIFRISKATVADAFIINGIVKTYNGATLDFPVNAQLQVNGGGILELATEVVVTGYGFSLNSSGSLKIGAPGGISKIGTMSGNVQTIVVRWFDQYANYTYNGGLGQVFGAAFPQAVNNLTIANPLGTFIFSATKKIGNEFFIADGSKVDLATFTHTAKNLYLAGIAQVYGEWGSTNSTVANKNSTYFGSTATGKLTVGVLIAPKQTNNNGLWGDNNIWIPSSAPSDINDVIISHNVSVTNPLSLPATCRNLTINLGASVTIQPGKALTVKGTLVNNGTLTIKSDDTGTGSLIHHTAGVPAVIERYIAAANWATANNGWHLLSSPVASQNITGTFTPTGTGNDYDFYAFDESRLTEYWLNQKVVANAMISFVTGKSYMVAYQQAGAKQFAGSINITDVTVGNLANTSGSAYPGWHLLGNPFACAINWATGNWTRTNMDAIAQVWDAATASYKTVTEKGNIIPAMNGFMVHTNGGGSITIPADARVHHANNFYKSSDEEFIVLKANDLEGSTSQSSIVRFNSQATAGFDSEFDSYYLSGYAPVFYSKSGDEYYALNTLHGVSESTAISFGFVKNASSEFTLELSRSITGEILCLEDLKTSGFQNLTENPVYAFTSAEGDDPNRFVLHFLNPTGVKPGISSGIQIYAGNKTLFINQADAQKGIITVYNTTGQLLRKLRLEASAGQSVSLQNFAPGIYVVAIQTAKGLYNHKVVVK